MIHQNESFNPTNHSTLKKPHKLLYYIDCIVMVQNRFIIQKKNPLNKKKTIIPAWGFECKIKIEILLNKNCLNIQ